MKPIIWDNDRAKKEIKKRLVSAKKYRNQFEPEWETNERALFNTNGPDSLMDVRYTFDSTYDLDTGDAAGGSNTIGINYLFKNFRFIHAQLSANPPVVLSRPTSSDPSDKKKADAADRLIHHAINKKHMQDKVDLASLKTLAYGTGWMKTVWNPHKGDLADYDKDTGEFTLEGEIEIYTPSTWDVWVDPDANTSDDIRYVFERKYIPLEEAIQIFPEKEEALQENMKFKNDSGTSDTGKESDSDQEVVELYEYWEKGLPINGMVGRHAIVLDSGAVIKDIGPSPFAFTDPDNEDIPPTAFLPFHIFTDIDIPDEIYGRSFVAYAKPLQDTINRLDSVTLDNVEAHGVTRLVLPEGAEVNEDAMTNSPWDIIKIKGPEKPYFFSPPSLMPDMSVLRDRLKSGADDVAGVNPSMFGDMQRRTSGFSLQYATNQGNMIRRRLFNKYTLFVENIYKSYLALVRKNWNEPRIIKVLGKEKAFESTAIKGADIEGGFDLVVKYGSSLSLDPTTRREELLQLMPLFEKAGIDTKTLVSLLKLDDLQKAYDINDLAEERQREIFDEMTITGNYIAPEELQEHKGMLSYAYQYIMMAEFKMLPDDIKLLILQHIKDREQLMAQTAGASQEGLGVIPPGPKPEMQGEVPVTTAGGIVPPQEGTPGAGL